MKTVIGISLGASSQNFEFNTTFLGEPLHVKRLGTDGSLAKATKLLKSWDNRADAIGLGVLKDSYKAGSHRFIEKDNGIVEIAIGDLLTAADVGSHVAYLVTFDPINIAGVRWPNFKIKVKA